VVVKDSWEKGSDKKLSRANLAVVAAPDGKTNAIGGNDVGMYEKRETLFFPEVG
jgi:hypothetical protein